jgi:hypothetical protein
MASSSVPGSPCEFVNITNMLSEEMWIQILSYLNQNELCTLSEVDSKFYRLARDPAVWRKECGSSLTVVPSDLKCKKGRMELRGGVQEPEKFYYTYITDHSG